MSQGLKICRLGPQVPGLQLSSEMGAMKDPRITRLGHFLRRWDAVLAARRYWWLLLLGLLGGAGIGYWNSVLLGFEYCDNTTLSLFA